MPFLNNLDTRDMRNGNSMVLAQFRYRARNSGEIIDVPIGFITDFASIPRLLRPIITGNDNTKMPAVIHDYLYRKGIGGRKDADKLFLNAMSENGVPWWKRKAAYLGVRAGGGFSWKGR